MPDDLLALSFRLLPLGTIRKPFYVLVAEALINQEEYEDTIYQMGLDKPEAALICGDKD